MRLIDTWTLELLEFFGDEIPKRYAILSHTWEGEEVTFQDWQDLSVARKKKGFFKIDMACRQAQRHDLDYLWVDTNCIDKTSSSELSEAINSMFSWYEKATICYAYLTDVRPMPPEWDKMTEEYVQHFCQSKWFTRGWTLQELLAPVELTFYSRDWSKIASRKTMAGVISETAEIEPRYLLNNSLLKEASVAEKMSWVSRRVTTRIEDMAYCMLGIFDINMPLLYGEGSKSFTRLQEEIIRTSNDHTIFCWSWIDLVPPGWVSLLAPCPQAFRNSGNFVSADYHMVSKPTFKMTNAGLSITLPIVQAWSYYLGVLNARIRHGRRDNVARLACVPILGHLDMENYGERRRGFMKRIPFPPGPVSVYSPWVLCQSRLYIRSNPGSTGIPDQEPPSNSPRAPLYSFLLTFDNVEQLLGDKIRTLGTVRSKQFNGICLMESAKVHIWTESYPPQAFDRSKSCIALSLTSLCSGALIRFGMNAQSRFIFIGVVLRANRPYRLCGIVPACFVEAARSESELLNEVIKVARKKEENCDFDWKYGIGIAIGEAVCDDSGMISVVYVTCERWHVGLDVEAELDTDDDDHSDISTISGYERGPCKLFSPEDI